MQPMRLNERSVGYDKGWLPSLADPLANDLEFCRRTFYTAVASVASRTRYASADSNGSLLVGARPRTHDCKDHFSE